MGLFLLFLPHHLKRLKRHISNHDLLKFSSCFVKSFKLAWHKLKCPRNRFLERFFCNKYRLSAAKRKKNLNASKNTSMNLIFLLKLSLFRPVNITFFSFQHIFLLFNIFLVFFAALVKQAIERARDKLFMSSLIWMPNDARLQLHRPRQLWRLFNEISRFFASFFSLFWEIIKSCSIKCHRKTRFWWLFSNLISWKFSHWEERTANIETAQKSLVFAHAQKKKNTSEGVNEIL